MKFLLLTLGCKVNTYESDATRELFLFEGYQEVENDEIPDIVVINTCAVTHVASKKSRQIMRKYRYLYEKAILVVMGCFVQEELLEVLKIVDANIVLGTHYRHKIVSFIKKFLETKEKVIALETSPNLFPYEEMAYLNSPLTTRAFVKIQDGCNNFCSYCIIPYLRGRSRSRKEEDIILEIQNLVKNGYQEIVLTGINLGVYGLDLESSSLTKLIKMILTRVPSLYLLRLSSIESYTISDELISLLKNQLRLAKHLHIPLQSGSTEVLKKMNRRYTLKEYADLIKKIKKQIPQIAISTDVIVGFPGEDENNFFETFNFIKEMNFSSLHVFPFSKRARTSAALMPKQVDDDLKKRRVQMLLELSKQLENEYQKMFDGQVLSVLFETYDKEKGLLRGHTSNYLDVNVKSEQNYRGEVHQITYFSNSEIKLVNKKQ